MLSFMARDSWSSQASVCPLQVQQPAAGTAGTLPQACLSPPPPAGSSALARHWGLIEAGSALQCWRCTASSLGSVVLGLQPAQLADRAALQGSQPWSSQLVRTCRAAFSSLFPFSLVWGLPARSCALAPASGCPVCGS
jgi:hypothetical protein